MSSATTSPTEAAPSRGDTPEPATLFNRPPRVLRTPSAEEVTIPGPPQAPSATGTMRLMAVFVPLASSLIYLAVAAGRGNLLSSLPIIIIAGLSAYFAYDTYKRQKRAHEAAVESYKANYQDAIERTRQRLEQLTRQQKTCYDENDPDLPELLRIAAGDTNLAGEAVPSARLWERRPDDPDFLTLRLGRGDRQTSLTLKLPSVSMYTSDAGESFQLAAQYQLVRNVPVGASLRSIGSLGIAGPSGRGLNMLQSLLWQIAVHHSPSEVRIAAFWDSAFDDSWEWLRWLPHTRPLDGDDSYRLLARYDRNPEDLFEVADALTKELKRRSEDDQSSRPRPHLVVVMSNHHLHRDRHPILTQCITAQGLDVSAICLVPEVRDVPSECGGYIDLNHSGSATHTRLGVSGVGGGYTVFNADMATTADSRALAMRLAPIELADLDGGREMPRNVPLLQLLGVEDAMRYAPQTLWAQTPAGSWHPVPVGRRSADEPLEVNLNEGIHGVHGMIAGATGSGKSELLLSFLMALAIRHHPDRLNFLLVDFKGGATFRDLEELPHTAGMVTDLSGFLAERALIAMNSELDRRKRLLAQKGIPNIRSYRKAGFDQRGEALPNLLIAIDEFDEMIRDYPQFQDELIRVSKQGRSLGVHLLFATQQPSLIKEGLLNNLSYWMSLRVNSREDSRAMVGLPDAAQLGTDTPGRGYFRDKNSGVRMFQSALITGLYRPSGGHSSREVDVTGHIRVNTGETRALQMLQVRLDTLLEQFRGTEIEAQRSQMSEAAIEDMVVQLDHIFERAADAARKTAEGKILRVAVQTLLSTIRRLPPLEAPDDVAEAIGQQIRAAARGMINQLLGGHEQISEIRLVVQQMVAATEARYAARRFPVWEEPLPSTLPLADLAGRARGRDGRAAAQGAWLDVAYGLMDRPEGAQYELLRTDLAGNGGNILAVGASGSGKTTLLHTIILALANTHSPADLWFYIIDGTGTGLGLRGKLPHLADAIMPRNYLLVERLLVELQDQVEVRRALFAQQGVSSLSQYREQQARAAGNIPPPAIVVVIDNLAELTGSNEQVGETLKTLMREGRAYGLYFLVSAYALRDVGGLVAAFETRLALHLNSDEDSHTLIGKDYASRLIKPDQPGRAFLRGSPRPLEVQIALPALRAGEVATAQAPHSDDTAVAYSDLSLEIDRSTAEVRVRWQGTAIAEERQPQCLRLLPAAVDLAALLAAAPRAASGPCAVPVGIEGASLQPLTWTLDHTAHMLVTGGPRAGKSSLLRAAAAALTERHPDGSVELILVDYSLRALRDLEPLPSVRRFTGVAVGQSKELRDITIVADRYELEAIVQLLSADLNDRLKDLRRGLPLRRRTVLVIDSWDLVIQDSPSIAAMDSFVRRGSDIGLHCLIAYTDPSVATSGMMRAARSNYIEVVVGRPVFESAPYAGAITRRFKGVLTGEMPQGRAFVMEMGQIRLAQLALAGPDLLAALAAPPEPDIAANQSRTESL